MRLLGSEYADRGVLLESLAALETELDELDESLKQAEKREPDFPHRERVLRLNRRLAQRIVDAHREWLKEVEAEL